MSDAAARIGIDFISALGMPPVPFVELVRALGCDRLTLGLQPITANPHAYPGWTLRDPQTRRETIAALADLGVTVAQAEGCFITPKRDAASFAADLDIFVELGIRQISLVSLDGDAARGLNEVGRLGEMAHALGLRAAVEFIPGQTIGTLADAVEAAGRYPGGGIVVDMMHLFRSGATVADLAAIDPALLLHAQLCDVPLVNPTLPYGEEALHERLIPGEGELPLGEAIAVLPAGIGIGLEIPMLSRARAGQGPLERLRPAVDAARALLAGHALSPTPGTGPVTE